MKDIISNIWYGRRKLYYFIKDICTRYDKYVSYHNCIYTPVYTICETETYDKQDSSVISLKKEILDTGGRTLNYNWTSLSSLDFYVSSHKYMNEKNS